MNPWLTIPLSDYERHMSLPQIAQAPMLADLMERFVQEHRPVSLAILGAAGGNGLERIDPAIVKRLVAVDANATYLATCSERFSTRFETYEPVTHDLNGGSPPIAPVDAVFAGLILEYVSLDACCEGLAALVRRGGTVATVVQLPSEDQPEVSLSPFTSLQSLLFTFHFVSPVALHTTMGRCGFDPLHREQVALASQKAFAFASWRRQH